jgi:hypothetical protein
MTVSSCLQICWKAGQGPKRDQLEKQMQKELDARNATELAEHKAALAMHPLRMAE